MDICAVDLCLVTDFLSGTVFSMLGMKTPFSSVPHKCFQKESDWWPRADEFSLPSPFLVGITCPIGLCS
jgi:hypothetical protein